MRPLIINDTFQDFYEPLSTSRWQQAQERFNDTLGKKLSACCSRIRTQTNPNVHLTKEEIQEAIHLMPSGKAPALERFSLKFINFLDWIMIYIYIFLFNSLQEEDKGDGDDAATVENVRSISLSDYLLTYITCKKVSF